jgi:hypothetical protein
VLKGKKRQRTLDLIHNLLFELEFYKYEIALGNHRNVQLLNQFYSFAEEFNSLYPNNDIDDFTDYLSYASNFEIEESNTDQQAIVDFLDQETSRIDKRSKIKIRRERVTSTRRTPPLLRSYYPGKR